MNDFSGIWLSLDVHRDKINKLIEEFKEADKKNREIYSDSHYKEERGKLVARYRKKIADEKESVSDSINNRFWSIQNMLDKWIATPLPESKVNMLYLIMQSGMRLNRAEFEVIQNSIGNNYFGNKILQALAERDGVFIKSSYGLETYERLLEGCISSADVIVNGFYGANPEWELVPLNVNRHIVTAAAAGAPLRDNCALHRAALIWDGSSIPCPKTKISSEDEDILNKLYSGCNNDVDMAARTKELLAETPEIKEALELTEYRRYIPEK